MEDLLAMKDTARSADLQRKLRGPDWTWFSHGKSTSHRLGGGRKRQISGYLPLWMALSGHFSRGSRPTSRPPCSRSCGLRGALGMSVVGNTFSLPLPGKQSYPAHGVRTLKSRYRMKTKPSGAICRIKIKYLFEERGCH